MKKNKLAILLSLASLFGVNAYAQTEQLPEVPASQKVLIAQSQLLPNADSPIRAEKQDPNINSEPVDAPAPPLSDMWVYAVGSTNCGWEYTSNVLATTCDHGGQQLRAAVLEIGYGYSPFAWMNGNLLPKSAMYADTPVCITNGYYTWPCTAGQTVVGFLKEYNLDGNQNGLFRYQNTSTNLPQNIESVQINIR
ncbi:MULTISPECIES: YolA family protein [Photorhabdus]|uniref:YolA family protein n=1 Tax=Photorhabdus TaxID=29487 RepID=UPI000699B091|nr:YolA family protein [Photorhabdus thracensis]MCC8421725.1 YolA family protein [Photorhabdus thracensis]